MPKKPSFLADRSDWMAYDRLISDLELECDVTSRIILGEPKMVEFPGETGLLKFHFLEEGSLWAWVNGEAPRKIPPLSLILCNGAHTHFAGTDPEWPTETIQGFLKTLNMPCASGLNFTSGSGHPHMSMITGKARMVDHRSHPIWRMLPPMIIIRPDLARDADSLRQTLRLAAEEARSPQAGSRGIINRLLEIAILQALRIWLAEGGILGQAFQDEAVSRVLAHIHAQPAHDWNIAEMSRIAGVSRTTFIERFQRTLGMPPAEYVANWRMHRAVRLLRRPGIPIAEVAHLVGYQSEPAFNRAFRRVLGAPPGQFIREQTEVSA